MTTKTVPDLTIRGALQQLVELKAIKRRMEAGQASESSRNYYEKNKELMWRIAEDVLAVWFLIGLAAEVRGAWNVWACVVGALYCAIAAVVFGTVFDEKGR